MRNCEILPDRTLKFKRNTFYGGENNKERVTVIVEANNATGTEKV